MKFSYVGVYEVQGKRLKGRGEYALHAHYLCPAYVEGKEGKEFIVSASELRRMWFDVLRAELNWTSDAVDKVAASVDSQLVKVSAAAYISKYMSKGQDQVESLVEQGLADCIPSQWWTCSQTLRSALKIWERKLAPEELDDITYLCKRTEYHADIFDYCHAVYAKIAGHEVCVGYSFKLKWGNPLISTEQTLKNLDRVLSLLV